MNKLLLLLSLVFLFNCESLQKEDCSTVLCVGDFSEFYLELIDESTKENILDERYSIADIQLVDDTEVALAIDSSRFSLTTLQLRNDDWTVGTYQYRLLIGNDFEIPIELDLALSGGSGCCSNILIAERLNINNQNIAEPNRVKFRISLE